VFEFDQEQLGAVVGLTVNILLWISLRLMIRAEVDRELVEEKAPGASTAAS